MFTTGTALACGTTKPAAEGTPPTATAEPQAKQESSAQTFGDEQLWTDKLRLNEVVEKNVDPMTALNYNRVRKLDLTAEQRRELIEYLKLL